MNPAASRKGIPFVISAPSGTGKTTLCRALLESDPNLELSVSHTTRQPRNGEVDGVDYHFVDREAFERLVDEGAFLEWARYAGRLYGTHFESIELPLAEGHDLLLEIEVQGASQVHLRRPDARLIFLLPPSLEVLESRLRGRGTDSEEEIQRRLAEARGELRAAEEFDYVVINDRLEITLQELAEIMDCERSGSVESLCGRFDPDMLLKRWSQADDRRD